MSISPSWEPRVAPGDSPYFLSRRTPPIGLRDHSTEGRGRTALVTGATAGIGLAWCELLAAKGFDIVPVARRSDRLFAVKQRLEADWSVSVLPIVADLSDGGSPKAIHADLQRHGVTVDMLVNNAGYGLMGRFADLTWPACQDFLNVIGINVIELTHLMLPEMLDRRWGRVVNTTSIAALFPGSPSAVLYSASKSMVHKFTEGLAAECEPFGVHCTASVPGATDTDIFKASGVTSFSPTSLAMQLVMMSPVVVARQAFAASDRGQRMIIHGIPNKLMAVVLRHGPRRLRYALSAYAGRVEFDTIAAAREDTSQQTMG